MFLLPIMKGFLALSVLPLLASASPIRHLPNAKVIPDSYIVFFKDHVSSDSAAAHQSWVQELHLQSQQEDNLEQRKRSQIPFADSIFEGLKHAYSIPGFLGYSGHFDGSVIEQIRQHPDVSFP